MARGVTAFVARDVSEQMAEELGRVSRFSVGAPFYLCSYIDPTVRVDVYPLRNSEIVELGGTILARALEQGGG